jgi:hypothetical protein
VSCQQRAASELWRTSRDVYASRARNVGRKPLWIRLTETATFSRPHCWSRRFPLGKPLAAAMFRGVGQPGSGVMKLRYRPSCLGWFGQARASKLRGAAPLTRGSSWICPITQIQEWRKKRFVLNFTDPFFPDCPWRRDSTHRHSGAPCGVGARGSDLAYGIIGFVGCCVFNHPKPGASRFRRRCLRPEGMPGCTHPQSRAKP